MKTSPAKVLLGGFRPPARSSLRNPAFVAGPTAPCRLQEHYNRTLAGDLMVLGFSHRDPSLPLKQNEPREWDMSSPYHINRANRMLRGNKSYRIMPRPVEFHNIPKLEKIIVHTSGKEALGDEKVLHSAALALQSITGARPETIKARTNNATWKLREGTPMGAKVTLKGPAMYNFLATLIEIVMPKLKDYPGVSANTGDGSGNVSFGFPPSAMAMFPEIEINYDMYPFLPGFHVTVHTSATIDRDARLLINALGIPLYGKEKKR